ncbi:class I SAM-dependent methyltransferase [Actinomadura graeca]|uniref:Class I SAM-dependent methyltransferase n=2 Tax=Actinomadura graeca TaxID=2750812 RepID=A0ABX8R5J4_9ACTN|nr:class I SAM-dependent methyltransferase [Actinomadura graeca]QXJ26330.1 class I SAM-dependent methyltransferase [Actinomadura graeca]
MAESFGSDAERYDRNRPRYPGAMIEAIVTGSPGPRVLDVGCGTGIAARQFQDAGCRVLGVEPDARMAALARRTGVEVEVASFEDWDPAGRAFDAVTAGQAWHWVDPAAGPAKAARILRPGGRLAAFWNVFRPPPDLGEAFSAVYRRVLPDSPIFSRMLPPPGDHTALLAKPIDGMRAVDAFGDPEQWNFEWERDYTRDEWLDLVPTSGGHTLFSPAKLEELLTGIGEVIDAAGGSFTMHYTALVLTTTLTRP